MSENHNIYYSYYLRYPIPFKEYINLSLHNTNSAYIYEDWKHLITLSNLNSSFITRLAIAMTLVAS